MGWLLSISALPLLALLLVSCGRLDDHAQPVPGLSDTAARFEVTQGEPVPGHRFVVTGDFDDDGVIDTVAEHLVDRRTGIETYKYRRSEDYEQAAIRLGKEWPLCYISSTDPDIDSIPLALEYPARGIAFMRNEGDLDGNGTDELSYVVDHLDLSSVNRCTVVTLTPEGWKEILGFEVREWQIPQLPGETKSYGHFGLQDAASATHDDSTTDIISQTLESFSFLEPIRPGVVRINTFADKETDSVAVGESITKVVRLPGSR